jgi:hypothetical protein
MHIVYSIKIFFFLICMCCHLQDIVSRISSGPRPVCVLSGTGVLSSAVIHHRGPSSGTTKYEVRLTCELLSTFVKKLEI